MEAKTGYPSIDKPWLDYYDEEIKNTKLPSGSMYRYIYDNNKEYLESVAIRYFKRKYTYRQLFEKIENCAKSFSAIGVNKGDIVTVQALAMPQVIIMLYALNKLGAIVNSIYITSKPEEVGEILKSTNSKVYVTIDSIYEKVKDEVTKSNTKNVILLRVGDEADFITKTALSLKKIPKHESVIYWQKFMSDYAEDYEEVNDEELTAVMVYTGGTTGKSKAVVLSNKGINAFVHQYRNAGMGFKRGGVFMNMLPPFIAFGVTVTIHLPLGSGIENIISVDPSAESVGKAFAKYKPNYFVHGLAGIESIIQNKKIQKMDLSFVKILAAGGESVPVSKEQEINIFLEERGCTEQMVIGYGMTEVGSTVCTASRIAQKPGSVGIPLPNAVVKIVDVDDMTEKQYNQEGEICLYTPTVMKYYFNNESETEKILKIHNDGRQWVHTGDIGSIDEKGFLTIVGRIKRIITTQEDGVYHKVYPQVVEEVLDKVADVTGVTLVGRPNGKTDNENELVAFVTTVEGTDWDELKAKLISTAENNLDSWDRPMEYRWIDKFPRTTIAKIDYRALEKKSLEEVKKVVTDHEKNVQNR